MMIRTFLLAALAALIATPAFAADRDGDGVDDTLDNCLFVGNPDQRDTNGDGFGNRCDADLNDDGLVTTADFGAFFSVYGRTDDDADFDGNGLVTTADFGVFFDLFGRPVGPGALAIDPEPITCNGGFCTIQVAPGIDLEAASEDIEALVLGFYSVRGDAQIYTDEGGVILGDAELVIEPGAGMLGTSLSPDYEIGKLSGEAATILPERVNVEALLGADIDVEIPLYDDAWYVLFSTEGALQFDLDLLIGNLEFGWGRQSWRMVLDPVDPFLYVGSTDAVPIPVLGRFNSQIAPGFGLDVTEVGSGYGVSFSGRIPFEPEVPAAIAETLPEVEGDSIFYGSFDLASLTPQLPIVAFEVRVEGIAITDEDPDDNGAFVFFGSDETSRDRIRAITGTTTPNVTIPLLPGLEFDLDFAGDEEPMPLTVISSKTDMDTANPRREAWVALDVWSLDALSGNAADWLSMPGERVASVLYFGPEEDDNFFRMATERVVEIDAARMAAIHGVEASELLVDQSIFEIDARRIEYTSESFIESIHPDVTYTASSSLRLVLPTSNASAFDLLIENEAELGGIALRSYGKQLTADSYRHWGRYETPNWGYALEGSFSNEGAWLEGSTNARLPYRYAAVDQVADIAGRIAATEEAERLANADYQANLIALRDYQRRLEQESAALEDERAALRTAQNWLATKRAELDAARNRDCGTCRWYDAPCLARVSACVAWKAAAIPTLEGAVAVAQAGVSLAQGALARVQAGYDEAALLVAGAQRAVDLALDARDDAREALVLLRAERDALPLEDGVIDARVALRLTRDGLTGTVSGTFQGADFGEGVVVNDAAGSRACFVVPQTNEELCAPL